MLNSWHFKYAVLMSALFAITVGYNACSNDAGFDLRGDLESIDDLHNGNGNEETNSIPNPTIMINNDAEYTNAVQVNLSLDSGGPADSMFISNDSDCSTGSWEAYQGNKVWDLHDQNQSTAVYVKYKFQDDPETACVKDEIIHDDIAPVVTFTQGVGSLWINVHNMNITFQATDAGSGVDKIECDNNGSGNYASCGNSIYYSNMQENQNYLLRVIATDKAGNIADPQQLSWRPDYTPPTVAFTLTPAAITADTTPDFSFLGTDLGSGIQRYECKLDSATSFTACLNVLSFSNLSDGPHSLEVRAIDNVNLVSQVIRYDWQQDTQAPTLEFTQTPNAIENSASATFAFQEVAGGIVAYECQLDQGPYQACTSPRALSGLADGRHTYSVVGLDQVGNRSAPISYSWLIDTMAPTVAIVQHPQALTNSTNATFSFTAQDVGAGVREIQCRVDGGAYAICQSTMAFANLVVGTHNLDVKAIDLAGNESAVVAYQWIIDNQGPVVQITSGPNNPTGSSTATFIFTATDSGSGIDVTECRVDGAAYASCTSPAVFDSLADGAHIFSVRARDLAGNLSNVANYSWSVDTTGPMIQFIAQPNAVEYIGSTPQVRFLANDGNGSGVATYTCLYNNASYPCQGDVGYPFPATAEGNNSFSVTATDNVGNMTTSTVTWAVQYQVVDHQKAVTINGERPVDILFVVDISGSMNAERKNLGDRIDGLLGQIGNLDWQIAVTSTDVIGSRDFENGRLTDFDGNGLHILTSDLYNNDPAGIETLFKNKVTKKNNNNNPLGMPEGDGNERGIRATSHVVDRALDPTAAPENQNNADFIRDNADFVAVVLSDENEGSNGNQNNVLYQPQEFLDRFNAQYQNQKSLTWHSIVTMSGDTACKNVGYSFYGSLYEELSNLTNGVIGSVCDSDYTNQLQNIGQSVADLSKTVALDCMPLDSDGDQQPDIIVTFQAAGTTGYVPFTENYSVQGQALIFDNNLPAGDYLFDYQCNN